jgi:chorismate mutase / prephenate dehydratase
MKQPEIAYLGPLGTYSHLVAEKRFGVTARTIPFPTIPEVFAHVAGGENRFGIVPIENSSGGAIYDTVDLLVEGKPKVHIDEEIFLNVKLALLGRKNCPVKTLYSHFAPMEHCAAWIVRHLPGVKRQVVASTAMAARHAFLDDNAAALASRRAARLYNLDVLRYPVEADIPNETAFLVIAGRARVLPHPTRTTLCAVTHNVPGGLCDFLDTFRVHGINLCRLLSRPIRGCPREYAFWADIEGGAQEPQVRQALRAARKACVQLRLIGSYPSGRKYKT